VKISSWVEMARSPSKTCSARASKRSEA
jgi:hypothetical protein